MNKYLSFSHYVAEFIGRFDNTEKCAVLIDESLDLSVFDLILLHQNNHQLSFFTNRFDQYQTMIDAGLNATFSDYIIDAKYCVDRVVLCLGKEKQVNQHWLRLASTILNPGALLSILGTKKTGANSFINNIDEFGFELQTKHKAKPEIIAYELIRNSETLSEVSPPNTYATLDLITQNDFSFYSKPGLFGWQKIDEGSALLVNHYTQLFENIAELKHTPKLLDLGCGYGYLSLQALAQQPQLHITASDNCAAALLACTKNLAQANLPAQVSPSDCGEQINEVFDYIVCNPPFHQGSNIDYELTPRFINAVHRCLKPHGRCLFVLNAFLPFEKYADHLFGEIKQLDNNQKFKIIFCAKPV